MASDNVIITENNGITVIVTSDPNDANQTIVVPQAGNSITVTPSNNQLEDTITVVVKTKSVKGDKYKI